MTNQEMQKTMEMLNKMKSGGGMDILRGTNPQFSKMEEFCKNPTSVLGKNSDIAQVMSMINNQNAKNKNSTKQKRSGKTSGAEKTPSTRRRYWGLEPIAKFAPCEIIYAMNQYFSTF